MRIAELSRLSGVSIPTIKYYLRSGLLPGGTPTGRNQADYDPAHLRRLRLIRALLDVGGLSVAAAIQVLAAVDQPDLALHDLLGVAHAAITPTGPAERDPAWQAARERAAALIAERGWSVHPQTPALDQLADVIAAAEALDATELLTTFDTYAQAAELVAERDLDLIEAHLGGTPHPVATQTAMVETLVTGTVLGESMLTALRRLAQEETSRRRFSTAVDHTPAAPS